MDEINTLKFITGVFVAVFGIPNQIIDYKHRKNKDYKPGNAWGYYSRLAREGSWEGKFMMWSAYLALYFILGITGYTFYLLSR